MNRVSLTSLYIQVGEERPSKAESVHTTAQARATAAQSPVKGKGTSCRVHWYIHGPVNIKRNVLQYSFTRWNTRRKYSRLGKINLQIKCQLAS